MTHILNYSEAIEWNHVPGAENPADDCSRGVKATNLSQNHRWFAGSEFLLKTDEQWPSQTTWRTQQDSKITDVYAVSLEPPCTIQILINEATSLDELKLKVAQMILLGKDSDESKSAKPNTRDYAAAMIRCIQVAQRHCYEEDVRSLSQSKKLPKNTRLRSLNPFIDGNGIIRVGGRLEHAELEEETRFPTIIPHTHPLADPIILDAHESVRHGEKIRTLSETRGRYWITKGLAMVSKIVRNSIFCKKEGAKATLPFMAPLPKHRLQPYLPAFTNVGTDYFGPFEVVVGRRHEKRYGVLFTCLVTRAIHLEMAHSLTTDSFVAAFRRFANRRGSPAIVYSDNGTNLVSGEKEMREAIERFNVHAEQNFQLKGIEWHFSPPSAQHFGGAWERLVKSCKITLRHVLQNQVASDEILYTALTEIKLLLNGRPLTHVSIDPKDPFPLTPNHFLLGSPYPNLPVAVISPTERLNSKS